MKGPGMPETKDTKTGPPQVFIYMDDWPHTSGSGAHLRFHSNTAAWVDLGWDVTVVRVAEKPTPPPDRLECGWNRLLPMTVRDSGRQTPIPFRMGRTTRVRLLFCQTPGGARSGTGKATAQPASAAPVGRRFSWQRGAVLPGLNAVFSHLDLSADALGAIYRISADLGRPGLTPAQTRAIRFMAAAEERIRRASRLILCISDYDREVLQDRFGLRHAVYFPMSVTPERPVARTAGDGETLRILHVGRVNHLPTYRSLEHLLREVFPRLQAETLDRLQLRVAGKLDEGDPKCRRILALGEPYRKQIVFAGFVEDLAAEHARADMQVVASTEVSGLRTRIVESMAWETPVLSTMVAARGIAGLDPGRNILIADAPEEFAAQLDRLARDKSCLLAIATGGSELYRTRNSRRAVAAELGKRLAEFYSL